MRYHIPSPHCGSMLLLSRCWYTLPFIFCKAMFRCSIDRQVSWPFPYVMNGNFVAATICTNSMIVAKMRGRAAMIVEVAIAII